MLFYWIIFQSKTSPLNSCRSYCRNVHRSDGKHGERVNLGLVSLDTERESSLMSQRTVTYACFAKKFPCQLAVIIADRWSSLPANPDCSLSACWICFPSLSAGWYILSAYCWSSFLFAVCESGQKKKTGTFLLIASALIVRSPTCV